MNPKSSVNAGLGRLAIVVAVMVAVSYWTTHSISPIQVYRTGSWGARISISVLGFLSVLAFFNVLFAMTAETQDPQRTQRRQIGCTGILLGILLIVSYHLSGSLNPVGAYRTGSTTAKLTIGVIAVPVALTLISMVVAGLSYLSILGSIKVTLPKGASAKDVNCVSTAVCQGKNLMRFMGAYGPPVRCVRCGSWWHQKCAFQEGGLSLEKGCPACPKVSAHPWESTFDN
jgi:amino acid transporter